jgi:GNAT superfamily N-acetyltransferase
MYTLRPAAPADAAVLIWLDHVATPHADAPPPAALYTRRSEPCRLPPDLARRWIVMVDGHAAGVVAVERGPAALVVTDLRLLPAQHRRGLGSELHEGLLAEARQLGLALALLVPKGPQAERGRAWLERRGFTPSGETVTHWRLTHALTPGGSAAELGWAAGALGGTAG